MNTIKNAKLSRRGVSIIVACAALVSFAGTASAASAAQWYVGGSPLLGSATLGASTTTGLEFEFSFGQYNEFKASGVEMIKSSISNAGGAASGSVQLRLTGVKMVKPSTCSVHDIGGSSEVVTTVPLSPSVSTIEGTTYEKFTPKSGGTFFGFELLKGTGACPISGTYTVTGTLVAEAPNLSSENTSHALVFSKAVAGRQGSLQFGGAPAFLTGTVQQTLSGANSGVPWSAH